MLTLTGDHGIDTLIDLARNDSASNVRGQALFWLGQKAGARAVRTLGRAVDGDPDHDVRIKAVFAISQLPKDRIGAEADRARAERTAIPKSASRRCSGWVSRATRGQWSSSRRF